MTPEAVSRAIGGRIELARSRDRSKRGQLHRWPQDKLPFRIFDGFFQYVGEDTEPAAEAWLSERDGVSLEGYAESLLAIAQTALANLGWNDPLLEHELKLARLHKHCFSHVSRAVASESALDQDNAPRPPEHEPGFYRQLEELLDDPTLVSVAYRGTGDWRLMRLLCTEQRRRANATGHTQLHALHLSALCDYRAGVDAWDARIRFFEEGLDHGDLFIESSRQGGLPIKELIETRSQRLRSYSRMSLTSRSTATGGKPAMAGWCFDASSRRRDAATWNSAPGGRHAGCVRRRGCRDGGALGHGTGYCLAECRRPERRARAGNSGLRGRRHSCAD